MTPTGLLAEAAEAWRVQQACEHIFQEAGSPTYHRFRVARKWVRWAAPPLLVLFALPCGELYADLQSLATRYPGTDLGSNLWRIAAAVPFCLDFLAVAALGMAVGGAGLLCVLGKLFWTTFDALHSVSARGVLLARYRSDAAWMVHLGGCLALFVCLRPPGPWAAPWTAACWAATAALLPAAGIVAAVLLALVRLRFGWPVSAGLLVLLAATAAAAAGSAAATQFPPFASEPAWLAPAGFIPAVVWPVATAALVIGAIVWQLHLVETIPALERTRESRPAEERPPASSSSLRFETRTESAPLSPGPAGLLGAALTYARTRVTPSGVWTAVQHAVVALSLTGLLLTFSGDGGAFGLFLAIVLAPSFFRSVLLPPAPQRLYLFGVDYRWQMLFHLAAGWADPAFLGITALWAGLDLAGRSSGVPWVLFVGLKLFTVGCTDWPYPALFLFRTADRDPARPSWQWVLATAVSVPVVFGGVMSLGILAFPDAAPNWLIGWLMAGLMGGLGVGGVVYKVRCLSEDVLRETFRELPP